MCIRSTTSPGDIKESALFHALRVSRGTLSRVEKKCFRINPQSSHVRRATLAARKRFLFPASLSSDTNKFRVAVKSIRDTDWFPCGECRFLRSGQTRWRETRAPSCYPFCHSMSQNRNGFVDLLALRFLKVAWYFSDNIFAVSLQNDKIKS